MIRGSAVVWGGVVSVPAPREFRFRRMMPHGEKAQIRCGLPR